MKIHIDCAVVDVNHAVDDCERVFTRDYADHSRLTVVWTAHPVAKKTRHGVFVRPYACRFPIRVDRLSLYGRGSAVSRSGWVFYSEAGRAAFGEDV